MPVTVQDFSPALLRVQATPATPLPRTVLYLGLGLFVATLLWATFGRLDIVAVAQGKLVPGNYVKIVQPAESGVVSEILVEEGERVVADQVLMRMDEQLARADTVSVRNDLHLRELQLRRIDAQLNGTTFSRRESDRTELFGQAEAQFHANVRAYRDRIDGERATLERVQQELRAAEEMEARLQQTVPIYREQERVNKDLADDGYVSRLTVLERTRERIEKEQELKAQAHQVAGLRASIDQSRKRIAQIASDYRQQLLNERAEANAQRMRLEQEVGKSDYRSSLLELRAPHDGLVKDLATHTVGTVVSPGTILMTLVPDNDPVKAEVWVTNVDAGFVRPGQVVKIKTAAYPFQKYGMIEGVVEYVSPDAATLPDTRERERNDAQPHVMPPSGFRALVTLAQSYLEVDGRRLDVTSGMAVSAEINLGERSVLEYVVSPVQKAFQEAGRER
jgi:HlyD family secretion protein